MKPFWKKYSVGLNQNLNPTFELIPTKKAMLDVRLFRYVCINIFYHSTSASCTWKLNRPSKPVDIFLFFWDVKNSRKNEIKKIRMSFFSFTEISYYFTWQQEKTEDFILKPQQKSLSIMKCQECYMHLFWE